MHFCWIMKSDHTASVSGLQDNSVAVVNRIFASNGVMCPAIPVYHLRDLIKR